MDAEPCWGCGLTKSAPFLIAFEGLDGSGKSTCAKLTAQALGATYMTTPSPVVRRIQRAILTDAGASQEAAQLFYLSTVFAASHRIETLLRGGKSVVIDRYFLSTQAYAEFRGSQLEVDDIGRLLQPAAATIFLEAALAVRASRIAGRGGDSADLETLTPEADAALREAHIRRSKLPVVGEFISIDTSLATPSQVTAAIMDRVREAGLLGPSRENAEHA